MNNAILECPTTEKQYCIGERRSIRKQTEEALLLSSADVKINNFITKPRYIKCKEWTEENDDDIVKGDLYLFRGYIGKRSGKYVEKNQIFQRMDETDVLTKIQFDDLDKNLGLHVVILPSQNGIMSRYIPPAPSTSSSLSSETNELNIKMENKNVKKKHTKLLKKRKKRDKDIVVVRRRSNRKSIPVIEVNVKNISEYRKCKIWPNSSIEEGDLYLYTKPNKEKQIFHRIKRSGVHHFTGFDMVDELTTIAYEGLDKKLGLYIKFLANGVAAPLTKTAHLPKSNPKKLSGKHANEKSDNKSASKRIVTKQKKQKVVIEKKQKIKKQLIQLVDKKSSTETSLSNSIPKITTVHSNKSQTNAKSVTLNSINKPMQEFPNIPNDDNNNNNKPCNGSENEKIDCIDSSKSNSNSNSNTSVRNMTRLSEKLAGGGGITCMFNEGSVLGFGLIEATDEHDNICIRILKIMPNTQAARYSAVLNEKCVIEQIGNDIIFNQSFNNVINLLRTAPRPLKIVFDKVPNLTDVES